ncbi:MAG: hypothetical protein GY930_10960 [bacterium]|nr:hypothetical protein [bacterium]
MGLPLAVLLSFALLASNPAQAQVSVSAQGSMSGAINTTPVFSPGASLEPFLFYTPLGPFGGIYVPFWKKHLPDDAGSFSFEVKLSRPVGSAGGFLWFSIGGTAEEGVHYAIPGANPIALSPGDTSVTVPLDILNPGQFYNEVSLEIELTQGIGLSINPSQRYGQLWLRSTTPPPELFLPPNRLGVAPGSSVTVPIHISVPSMEPVSLHYSIDPVSDLSHYLFVPSGKVIIPAGDTRANLRLFCGLNATPGETLVLNIRHERDGVRHVIPPLDPMLTSNPDLYPQVIHLDENLWSFSVGGVQEFENHHRLNPAAFGPSHPGVPSDNITGGSYWAPGHENEELIDLLDQMATTPILDPFSRIPLKIYAISEAASGFMPYLRKSFNGTFCGANAQMYELPEFTRVSYYIAMPSGVDAHRGVPFFRIGMRVRTQNMNHAAVFRVGSMGLDHAGNTVTTVPTSLGPIGIWDTSSVNTLTDRYGIVEDEFGVRVWFSHRLDPTVPFLDGYGNPHFETPGLDLGNPIEYPAWLSHVDGSMLLSGIPSANVSDAVGRGNLIYGLKWEVSENNSIFNGNLRPYFPKRGAWWEPQGNAVIGQESALEFVVQ